MALVCLSAGGPLADEGAPKRPRLDTFVLQPEDEFLSQFSGASKVCVCGGGLWCVVWVWCVGVWVVVGGRGVCAWGVVGLCVIGAVWWWWCLGGVLLSGQLQAAVLLSAQVLLQTELGDALQLIAGV